MLTNLYFLHYNNYYNRKVKKFDTIAEYLQEPYYLGANIPNASFNPNDGVDAQHVCNIQDFDYDYMIVTDKTQNIVSRWFVIESRRERTGQYTLTLKRDQFADSYDAVVNAPAFIEKATLSDNDPLIFNKEDMTVNQIKKSETLLKDTTGSPWIVGYMAKGTNQDSQKTVTYSYPPSYSTLEDFQTLFNSMAYDGEVLNNYTPYLSVFTMLQNERVSIIYRGKNIDSYQILYLHSGTPTPSLTGIDPDLYIQNWDNIKQQLETFFNIPNNDQFNELYNYNNKIIYDNVNDILYKVKFQSRNTSIYTPNNYGSVFQYLETITNNSPSKQGTVTENTFICAVVTTNVYTYTLERVSGGTLKYQINSTSQDLEDAPYKMFAIPYGKFKFLDADSTVIENTNDEQSKIIARAVYNDIIEQFGGSSPALYDIQLLPYFPMQDLINSDGSITLPNTTTYCTNVLDENDNVIDRIVWSNISKNTFNIPYIYNVDNVKVSNQCDFMRLCSPNWNGQFEFSPAKNGGITAFNVDFEYKPFQPYIHLNPNFNKLYGQDFDDARGLICNGDFSLTQISDAWATYERQNVNYQKSFDRQIQNMEVNNAIQNTRAITQAALGTVGGILGGAMAGGIGGAIVGGTASAIGGTMDIALQRAGQAEAIDYTKDQFGYALGNIKALPDSLTKVSALNNNNKIFPVLEFYSCTDEEKTAFENKIKYNGMTVMRIGTISEFIKSEPTYIKGKLIRVEDIDEDFHYINELANEFNKGVFI